MRQLFRGTLPLAALSLRTLGTVAVYLELEPVVLAIAAGYLGRPLYARITIALAQQHKYLAEKPAEEIAMAIERANEYAAAQEQKGEDVNLGALYQTAFMQGWRIEQKAKLEVAAKKVEKRAKAVKAKEAAKVEETKAEQGRDELRKAARNKFDQLDAAQQSILIDEFGKTLRGFPLTTFKKTGISSAMLAPTFATWLIGRFNSQ